MSFAGKRSSVDCMAGALAMNGWPDECDVLGAETSNEGALGRQDRGGVLMVEVDAAS